MPAPSLYELARQRIISNIHNLDDIGDLPWTFIGPIIRHVQSPTQLATLEENCPQIKGETGDIWLRFIKRDIPNWESKPHEPRDPNNWSKVYKRLLRDAEREKAAQEEELRQKMQAMQQKKQGKTLVLDGIVKTQKPSGWGGSGSGWGISGAPAKTGRAALDKLKRGMFDIKRAKPKTSMTPNHVLEQRKGTVHAIPQRLVRMAANESAAPTPEPKIQSAAPRTQQRMQPSAKPAPKIRQVSAASPPAAPPPRPRLPPGQTFTAPRIKTQATASTTGTVLKRKRDEPNVFMAQKRKA